MHGVLHMQAVCRVAFLMTSTRGVAAMVLIWLFYPTAYNYASALKDSNYFIETQRVGVLPDKVVPWRGNSLLQEYTIPFAGKSWDFGGGYMTVRSELAAPLHPLSDGSGEGQKP